MFQRLRIIDAEDKAMDMGDADMQDWKLTRKRKVRILCT